MAEEAIVIVRAIPVAVVLASMGCNPADQSVDHAPPLTRADELARTPPQAIGGGPAAVATRDEAVERVARARCEKLRDCPSVLADRYQTADVCVGREIARVQNMWRDEKCTNVDTVALDACTRAARAEKCDTKNESLFTPITGACAATRICPPQ